MIGPSGYLLDYVKNFLRSSKPIQSAVGLFGIVRSVRIKRIPCEKWYAFSRNSVGINSQSDAKNGPNGIAYTTIHIRSYNLARLHSNQFFCSLQQSACCVQIGPVHWVAIIELKYHCLWSCSGCRCRPSLHSLIQVQWFIRLSDIEGEIVNRWCVKSFDGCAGVRLQIMRCGQLRSNSCSNLRRAVHVWREGYSVLRYCLERSRSNCCLSGSAV